MSSTQPCPDPDQSSAVAIDFTDIANYESFMDSLITFMNESAFTIQQVKERSGIAPGCTAPVRMNVEEKQQKMNDIVFNLSETYKAEATTLSNESAYQAALDAESAHNTGFMVPSSQYRPPATSSCPCPSDMSQNLTSPSRLTSRGRRTDTSRPGATPTRGRVPSPDPYYLPLTQSSMNSPSACPALPLSPSGAARSRGRGRAQSSYPTRIDTGGLPDAYRGTSAFDNITSQSGRGQIGYPTNSPGGWGGECARDCTVGSINVRKI